MLRSALCLVLVVSLAGGLVGCGGGAYVNIPAQSGDVASNNPNSSRVRSLVIESVQSVIEDAELSGPIELTLPDETTQLTHAAVADAVPQIVEPDAEPPARAMQVAVRGVRIRGTSGEVDIRRPRSADSEIRQLVTVYSSWDPFSGWMVQRSRVWRGVVDDS